MLKATLFLFLLAVSAVADDVVMMEGDVMVTSRAHAIRGFKVPASLAWGHWPNGLVPYRIDPLLPNPDRVLQAIAHFESLTNVRFVRRTTQAAYVNFHPWSAGYCRSFIGRTGAAQNVDLDPACDKRSVIHEIGHAVGLWHEHTRPDRDKYVRVNLANVAPAMRSNFDKRTLYAVGVGAYDISSVMHYRPYELSANGKPTVTRLDGATGGLSNPDGLSAGDVATLLTIYPHH